MTHEQNIAKLVVLHHLWLLWICITCSKIKKLKAKCWSRTSAPLDKTFGKSSMQPTPLLSNFQFRLGQPCTLSSRAGHEYELREYACSVSYARAWHLQQIPGKSKS